MVLWSVVSVLPTEVFSKVYREFVLHGVDSYGHLSHEDRVMGDGRELGTYARMGMYRACR